MACLWFSIPRGLPRGLIEASSTIEAAEMLTGEIPRGLPRGLIEAHSSDKGGPGAWGIPRGLPRGLIEAGDAIRAPRGRDRDSAGTSPRPH